MSPMAAPTSFPEFRQDPFDTQQLECRVFKLWLKQDISDTAALASRIDAVGADLICCFSRCSAAHIDCMQRLGFRLISVRQTYDLDLASDLLVPDVPGFTLRLAAPGEALSPQDLSGLAETIGSSSRYFKDPSIPRARSQALYESWLRNSLAGYATAVVLGGVIFVLTWDVPAPTRTIEVVVPDEKLPR